MSTKMTKFGVLLKCTFFSSIVIVGVTNAQEPIEESIEQSVGLAKQKIIDAEVDEGLVPSPVPLDDKAKLIFVQTGEKKDVPLVNQRVMVTATNNTNNLVASKSEAYSWQAAQDDLKAIKWEAAGTFAGITALGAKSWNWGSSSFHFNNEGLFGKKTGSGGSDKLGHAFTSYALTNAFAERLQAKGRSPQRAALSAALLTQTLMLYVEAFDGMSGDHGFAKEDVLMNALGTGLAYWRQTNPKVKDLIDFRMEYLPSGYKSFRPLSDYEGQKYLIAFKFSGVKPLKKTPLKYFELQAGYYSRGFSKQAQKDGQEPKRHAFVGVGVNLSQLLFGAVEPEGDGYEKAGRFFLEHVQLPYTAIRTKNEF